MSLPAWGAWIEIQQNAPPSACLPSLPAWGAWIEIPLLSIAGMESLGRSPHGERGLKFATKQLELEEPSRSPHGERGLKSLTEF